ncbi:POTRA domain-containing protein [Frigoriglobus tundricola]|uniref:POTRA domain-containing protein n=1 Tax=Frigoriglobus tundricola TaxID=2774151 RepID=A0A6M5YG45_9BACT|nr:POTRA domain-containing protein [Frigoriglobus tundricola]QJW92985.1 hypothetical protein FTUN_0485 [Frigoriglobus tundricola]
MAPSRYTVRPSLLLIAFWLGHTSPAAEPPAAQPATVRDVSFSGADHLSKGELRDLTGVRAGDLISPVRNERGRQAILRKYQEEGRLFASVELIEGRSVSDTRVAYEIVEGPVVKVAEIQFRGTGRVGAEKLLAAKRASGAITGKTLRPDAIETDVKTLVGYYRELGSAGTKITPEVIRSSDLAKVTIVYHVSESN